MNIMPTLRANSLHRACRDPKNERSANETHDATGNTHVKHI